MRFVSLLGFSLPVVASLLWHSPVSPQTAPPQISLAPQGQLSSTLTGRVEKDGAPVAGIAATLHRVSEQQSGPVDTRTTGPNGDFRFELPPPDSGAFNVFFVSVDYLTVRYFGAAVHATDVPASYPILVYDTTATPAPGSVRVARRDVILLPEADGTWSGNELVRVANLGEKTIVPVAGTPVLEFALPTGATELEITENDAATEELQVVGDRAFFVGNLSPGSRELFIRYRLLDSREQVELQTLGTTDTLNMYVPDDVVGVEVEGLGQAEAVPIQDQTFIKYGRTDLPSQHQIRVLWSGGGPPISPVTAGVVTAMVVLGVGTWAAIRRRDAGRGIPAFAGPGLSPGRTGGGSGA